MKTIALLFNLYCAGLMFLPTITVVSTAMYVIYSTDVPAVQDPKVNLCWRITSGRLELSRSCQVIIKSFFEISSNHLSSSNWYRQWLIRAYWEFVARSLSSGSRVLFQAQEMSSLYHLSLCAYLIATFAKKTTNSYWERRETRHSVSRY